MSEMIFNPSDRPRLNGIGHDIIGCAYEVRNTAGRYFRENYYKFALAHELRQQGHLVEVEKLLPALYKGIPILDSLRMDLLVDNSVVVEIKALHKWDRRNTDSYSLIYNYRNSN